MFTIKLGTPATKGQRTITELNFQEPKVRHILATDRYDAGSHSADVALVAALSGEAEELIGEIAPEDWAKIRIELVSIYSRFLIPEGKENPTEKAENTAQS